MHKNVIISWSIEFGPLLLFFLSLFYLGSDNKGFLISTAIFTFSMVVALFFSYFYEKRVALFPLITGTTAVSFGISTLIFENPIIFILKDTFYNAFFAILILITTLRGKSLMKILFYTLFDMSDRGWYILSIRWGIAFTVLFVGNEISWRYFGQDFWVVWKLWSTVGTMIFGFYQITLSKKYRNKSATKMGMRKDPFNTSV